METLRPNGQKHHDRRHRIARAPWWLLITIVMIAIFILTNAANPVYQELFAQVRQGIWVTIWVSAVSYLFSLIFGFIIALLRRSDNVIIYQLATLFVEIVRGIPTLVIVYFIVLVFTPQLVSFLNSLGTSLAYDPLISLRTRDINNTTRAIIGLTISYSAFISEIFRAGIDSISQGQSEAAYSLGMSRWQTMRLVILPQAVRNILPPLANDFIALLKESSLVSIVGVEDITRQGSTYGAANFRFFESYLVVSITYLALTLTLSLGVKLMEHRLRTRS